MKKLVLLSAVSILALTSADAFAASKTFEGATATAEIVAAVDIKETTQMNFGKFLATPGTATLGTDSNLTTSEAVKVNGITPTAALFTITGPLNTPFTVDIPSSIKLTTSQGGSGDTKTMMVSQVKSQVVKGTENAGTFASEPSKLNVGGTLTIGSKQAAGSYTGKYNITVNY